MSSKLRGSTQRHIGVFLLVVGLVAVIPLNAAGQGTLTLTLNRNVGMAFGSFIQGSFTLHGGGPENVQNLTVYFNDEEVRFVTGNSIVWVFNTDAYPSGPTNITLFGVDDVGGTYSASRQVTFMGPGLVNIIVIVIGGLVVVLVLAKYGPRLVRSRKK
jgi:hypothetical protein